MVATRRTARRREPGAPAAGGRGCPPGREPPDAAEMASAENSTPVSMRMTRRMSKATCRPEVIHESQVEELEHADTKSDVSDTLEMQTTRNQNKTVPKSVAEPQADGDVSETESNCSSVSGLQTPLFIRVTRRRQIVVPYQPDSPAKKRHDRTAFLNELIRTQDEDDVSEAESCSSAVSGVQMPNVTRTTRSRQSKKKVQSDPICEAQGEDISDVESCRFLTEPSVATKRITRSMRMKSEAENMERTEKVNKTVSEDQNLIEDTVKSEPITISDSRPAAKGVSDTEDISPLTQDNEESSSLKSKCSPRFANITLSEDVKQDFLNDMTPSSLAEVTQSTLNVDRTPSITESSRKKAIKDIQTVGVDDSEEECRHIQEEHSQIFVAGGTLKSIALTLTDCMNLKQSLESQEQITPNKSEKNPEEERADAEAAAQESFNHADELSMHEQSSVVSSPQKDIPIAQMTDSIVDESRMLEISVDSDEDQTGQYTMLEISVDSDEDQTGQYTEPVSHGSKRSNRKNDSFALFLNKDESDESENSDVADTCVVEEDLSCTEADERTPSLNKSLDDNSLHAKGLFVIDTEPGMGSSQKYYLDQVDLVSDGGSKPEESAKVEESSDLEEDEEELIDEDEKDEEEELLKNKIDVLHLSSSIDPGLNIKKLGGLYISFDAKKQKPGSNVIKQLKEKKKDELLQKSIITPDFEKKECVPPFRESLHQLKKQRKAEREKTTGDGWFGMKAPEITSELKNDLKVLKMRASLDPKHFYKKNDREGLPKYFQVGTVVDSPIDFYHSRIPKKQRKRTIVEELLADSEFRRYNKRKYQEIMSEKAAFAAGKKNRKKKKFHN
ncbi:deoxynucleotidyltransferase terminal-interacting protein 2 isoform X2 [Dromaius novaehollandiae]|uniref:deoxynucleotidyltransferase terminal-interacting protein 2 isoform X2 n=1 Tax=Dromaius novaehollandiae TaxID=8790 RepID=UPI0031200167